MKMSPRTLFAAGGVISSVVLLAFGVAMIVIGLQGRNEVRDTLREENIVAPDDSSIPGQLVDTGSEAKAMAEIIRQHTLARTGATYSELPRYLDTNGEPTNDTAAAEIGPDGEPLANPARTLWVTETALTTALNTAYFAEQVGLMSVVLGVALILTGVGFIVLTIGAFLLPSWRRDAAA